MQQSFLAFPCCFQLLTRKYTMPFAPRFDRVEPNIGAMCINDAQGLLMRFNEFDEARLYGSSGKRTAQLVERLQCDPSHCQGSGGGRGLKSFLCKACEDTVILKMLWWVGLHCNLGLQFAVKNLLYAVQGNVMQGTGLLQHWKQMWGNLGVRGCLDCKCLKCLTAVLPAFLFKAILCKCSCGILANDRHCAVVVIAIGWVLLEQLTK